MSRERLEFVEDAEDEHEPVVEQYDAIIFHDEEEVGRAELFRKRLLEVVSSIRVVTFGCTTTGGMTFHQRLEEAIASCTFMLLLVTKKFCEGCGNMMLRDTLLSEMLSNVQKRWCLVPVWTIPESDYSRPMVLRPIVGIAERGMMEPLRMPVLSKLFTDRLPERMQRERLQERGRQERMQARHRERKLALDRQEQRCRMQAEEEEHGRRLQMLRSQREEQERRERWESELQEERHWEEAHWRLEHVDSTSREVRRRMDQQALLGIERMVAEDLDRVRLGARSTDDARICWASIHHPSRIVWNSPAHSSSERQSYLLHQPKLAPGRQPEVSQDGERQAAVRQGPQTTGLFASKLHEASCQEQPSRQSCSDRLCEESVAASEPESDTSGAVVSRCGVRSSQAADSYRLLTRDVESCSSQLPLQKSQQEHLLHPTCVEDSHTRNSDSSCSVPGSLSQYSREGCAISCNDGRCFECASNLCDSRPAATVVSFAHRDCEAVRDEPAVTCRGSSGRSAIFGSAGCAARTVTSSNESAASGLVPGAFSDTEGSGGAMLSSDHACNIMWPPRVSSCAASQRSGPSAGTQHFGAGVTASLCYHSSTVPMGSQTATAASDAFISSGLPSQAFDGSTGSEPHSALLTGGAPSGAGAADAEDASCSKAPLGSSLNTAAAAASTGSSSSCAGSSGGRSGDGGTTGSSTTGSCITGSSSSGSGSQSGTSTDNARSSSREGNGSRYEMTDLSCDLTTGSLSLVPATGAGQCQGHENLSHSIIPLTVLELRASIPSVPDPLTLLRTRSNGGCSEPMDSDSQRRASDNADQSAVDNQGNAGDVRAESHSMMPLTLSRQ